MSASLIRKPLEVELRYLQQNARTAIRDVYDAIIELVTNADDAYARAGRAGRIDIEIQRRRQGAPSLLRVCDHATGLSGADMDEKLARLGSRHHSGLAEGERVRGTNSRGAKDVMALGRVTFESIGPDQLYAVCTISPDGYFTRSHRPARPTAQQRRAMGIPRGSGTVVTIELESSVRIPQHATLARNLSRLVPLREILADPDREVRLCDVARGRFEPLRWQAPRGTERVKQRLTIRGYPGISAKLIIKRSHRPLEGQGKFRQGGILIRSRRAVHEATYFAPELEHDPHAACFFGTLRCEYIDDLWNELDERSERGQAPDPANPTLILDPLRQGGLLRDHPFVKALFQEALKLLRPLVEQERQLAESQRASIESDATRRRLSALERAATRFMEQFGEEADEEAEPGGGRVAGGFQRRGHTLYPPFAQIVVGHAQRFWFNVSQVRYPGLSEGTTVQVTCETDDVSIDRGYCPLEPHPARENTLRCTWQVRGRNVCLVTGITVRAGEITAAAPIEVLASEKDRFADLDSFCFHRKRYRVTPGVPRSIRLLAPSSIVSAPTVVRLSCADARVEFKGDRTLQLRPALGIAECRLRVIVPEPDVTVVVSAEIDGHTARTTLHSGPPEGEPIQIRLEDVDMKNQRSRWRGNVLEIAARHPSVRRYVGSKAAGFEGQEKPQFRVLLAEIVAYAVCERLLGRNVRANPDDYRDHDIEAYLAERDQLVTRFLPIAHENQLPDPG